MVEAKLSGTVPFFFFHHVSGQLLVRVQSKFKQAGKEKEKEGQGSSVKSDERGSRGHSIAIVGENGLALAVQVGTQLVALAAASN